MSEITLAESITSDNSNVDGKDCTVGHFISESDGQRIVALAAAWVGTPYRLLGAGSEIGVGGDCSGTTNKIFVDAGFRYPYQSTSSFAAFAKKTNRFRQIDLAKERPQAGDILLWPGHMAIYAAFKSDSQNYDGKLVKHGVPKFNDIYTAFRPGGRPYGPFNSEMIRNDRYVVYRYYILPGEENCEK
ncbi:NlpC/P60 family protein [Paraburkholderia silviterrae]|uniref:Peptidoglycan endopeptidase n=1 Tax=Paraburkholderia silviterrae TaxID=2528715 RepID=A0A4V6PJ22_9BURK|nr:NlpC/P60 family protein [Paraburkholderia silviterrae]TDG20350.1 peptidoglycan endopeptidase [Paraburkholderia silviterrae]